MSTNNPTPLRVGAKGTLHGWSMTVVGRVVLGVELDGERCYWNEFNLVDAAGNSGTLVYEETEDGAEWKLFQLLTPRTPMTVAEAERKKVGDHVSFGGAPIPVTLVDRSTVYHIEGTAPEGVEVGDLADFFNADAGDHMIVASWTGNEIEFYEGRDVPAETIATAFGLSRGNKTVLPSTYKFSRTRARPVQSGSFQRSNWSYERAATADDIVKLLKGLGGVLVVTVIGIVVFANWPEPDYNAPKDRPRQTRPTPTQRLAIGAIGNLGERNYLVEGQALVQIFRIGGSYERCEYELAGEGVASALLVNGLTGGTRQWHLLTPVTPPPGFSPFDAAALRKGSKLSLGGTDATVTELFLSQPRTREGNTAASLPSADKVYGFLATSAGGLWLARWTEQSLALHRGTAVEETSVLAALGPGPEKTH